MSTQEKTIPELLHGAREAARTLATLCTQAKNTALAAMASGIEARREAIKAANQTDLAAAASAGLSDALRDRLRLDDPRIDAMVAGIHELIALPDPVGELLSTTRRDNGLVLEKVRVPIGVIGIIYESRPNVTADAAALCIKAGNAVVLRGGTDAYHSNAAIAAAMVLAAESTMMPAAALQLIGTTDRSAITELVQARGLVDLIIPRGGEGLIETVTRLAHVPVIKHYKGVCHTYVDADADPQMALAICENAKVQRPGVCNAMETLVIHQRMAPVFLPLVAARLRELKVELRGDERARAIVPWMSEASEEDWSAEYLDLILAVRVVNDVDAAIAHIARYGSAHSDAIVTENQATADHFLLSVDSAAVYHNASTRFTDGAQFGLGAEIGISTDKLHARGPMGLSELTSYKYLVRGHGQIRA